MNETKNNGSNKSNESTSAEIKPRIPQLEEGYEGRDWKKFFTILAFFFIILIVWYVLKALSME